MTMNANNKYKNEKKAGISALCALPSHKITEFKKKLESLELISQKTYSAEIFECPIIELTKIPFCVPNLSDYEHLIFTSSFGTEIFLSSLPETSKDILADKKLLCVGRSIELVLEKFNLKSHFKPSRASIENLFKEFNFRERKTLIVCGKNNSNSHEKYDSELIERLFVYESYFLESKKNEETVSSFLNNDDIAKQAKENTFIHLVSPASREKLVKKEENTNRIGYNYNNYYEKFIFISSSECAKGLEKIINKCKLKNINKANFICIGEPTKITCEKLFPFSSVHMNKEKYSYEGMLELFSGLLGQA